MNSVAVLAAILEEAKQHAAEIKVEADGEAEQLLEHARREAAQSREQARRQVLQNARPERRAILHRAEVQAREIRLSALHDMFEQAEQQARDKLAMLRDGDSYSLILERLVAEALTALRPSLRQGETPRLAADPRDEACLAGMPDARAVEVDLSLRTWGGVVASSADQQVRVDNRLESRLERALPALRQQWAARELVAELE